MPEPQPFLVYRDQIGAPSEIAFLRRQYVGFTRLRPIWIGRTILPAAPAIAPTTLRLGGTGPTGPLNRLLFRHLGTAPPIPMSGLAPIIHAQFARGGALALPLAQTWNSRLVVTLHGGDVSKTKNWRRTVLSQRWPALVRYASHFVCVSEAVADIALSRGAPPDKLIVLPIGVEVPATPPPAVPPTAHLFVGRFVEKKGIATLAAAIRQLRAAGDTTPVICVGDGKLRPILESLAAEVPNVTLTGWLDPAAIRPLMASAHALLVPSIIASDGDAEGLPSVIPEAMAQACPVIGSDQGGITEAIRTEETGLLIPPGDHAALAAAMHRIAGEQQTRARMGTAAYADVSVRLNADIQSKKLETLLLSAATKTG
jgi:glycosyltransferase involved in cell wall biosynthesis